MKTQLNYRCTIGLGLIFMLVLSFSSVGMGQDEDSNQESSTPSPPKSEKVQGLAPGEVPPEDSFFPPAPEQPAKRKHFSSSERQKICEKYKGRLIAFYGDVYRVENCKRRPIVNNKTVYGFMRDGQEVVDVENDVIVALAEGQPIDLKINAQGARGCKELEAQYVSYSSTDVYFVEKCMKRIFPDWATYVDHRQHRGDGRGEILSLTWLEFSQLGKGRPIPSIIDDMFAKLLRGDGGTDLIPVDEACAGLEGKVVAFYSRLYRVERCRKREFTDPEAFMLRAGAERQKIPDLNAQKWLSLPDGVPIREYKRYPEVPPAKPVKFGRKSNL
jgi:hypothetical protein